MNGRTANDVLAAVKKAMSQSKLDKITVVGHSLGMSFPLDQDQTFVNRVYE
jgi:hypothetical protein